ncbi:MAG: PIG-L family deacetylase, partial [Devosiaceae bacterium]|nr:PIG-L family deacetylase [Devosiaceae bacterium]
MSLTDLDRIKAQQNTPRIISLWVELQSLRSCVSFMNTGAHPDDETSPMLAALGLRDGVKISQACSTRGESGQNSIGTQVSADLGVVRTREMERAAKALNMSHYWLSSDPKDSIFDFGFSKSGEETLEKWGKQRTLERFVTILRRERPDIVCPTFLDVSGQHGHHRAMTPCAFEAVLLAADEKAFPELDLTPWQVKKIYLPAWSGAGQAYDDDSPPPKKTTLIDASGADPVLGADYAQIGQWSRAFHATQQMGEWIDTGAPSVWPLNLAWSANGKCSSENDIFESLPKTLTELALFAGASELASVLSQTQEQLDAAIKAWPDNRGIVKHACAALGLIEQARKACPQAAKEEILHRLVAKELSLAKILLLANKISYHTRLSTSQVRPRETISINLNLQAPELEVAAKIIAPPGWEVSPWQDNKCQVEAPPDAPAEQGYREAWHANSANAPLHMLLTWKQQGREISVSVDLEEDLYVLPAFSLKFSPPAALINLNAPKPAAFSVLSRFPCTADITLDKLPGWSSKISQKSITLTPDNNVREGLYEFAVALNESPVQVVHK